MTLGLKTGFALLAVTALCACGAAVVPNADGIAVVVTPGDVDVEPGGSVSFHATVTGATNTAVTWSVKEGAAGGTITADGVYTAPAESGTYHVVATTVADKSKNHTVRVKVGQVTVAISPPAASVAVSGSLAFSALVTGTSNTAVIWSVLEISGCGSVAQDGVYTAPPAAATCHVVAASAAVPMRSATATVTVTPVGAATVPGAPTGVSATAGNGQATVSWTAPASDGGSPITGYRATSSPGGLTASVGGASTAATVTGLSNGTSYTFTVVASNAVGDGPSSPPSAAVTPTAPGSAVAFPVRISANGRYLQDPNGVAFPILGRTAWFVMSLPATDQRAFIADTVSRGYNAIELHVLDHDPRGNRPPFDGNGDLPFTKRLDGATWSGSLTIAPDEMPDFTTPNEAYWTFVDAFLSYCESQGVLVFFFPAYVGYGGGDQGWMQEMVANGPTRMQSYGTYVATRYKDQRNLVWMLGGDMGTAYPFNSAQTAVEQGLLDGINGVAGKQSIYFSAEWSGNSIATDQSSFGSSMTLNGAYSGSGDVNTYARNAYAHTPIEPAFLLEEPYDEEGPDGNGVNPSATQPVRRFQWWGILSAIGGYISGNGYVWPFNTGWQSHLDTQGSRDMARLNAFVRSIPWYKLVPSGLAGMKTLVTAGGGSLGAVPTGDGYVAAAATPDGVLLVAYVGPAHTGSFSIDMTAMSGATVRARWFNPTTAAYTSVGTFPNTGTHSFTPPGDNGSGFSDWVLVLDLQ